MKFNLEKYENGAQKVFIFPLLLQRKWQNKFLYSGKIDVLKSKNPVKRAESPK